MIFDDGVLMYIKGIIVVIEKIDIEVAGFWIDAGGSINVNGRGYVGQMSGVLVRTFGNMMEGAAGTFSGGSYGGQGYGIN